MKKNQSNKTSIKLKKVLGNLVNKRNSLKLKASGELFTNLPNTWEPMRKDLWSIEFPNAMAIPESLQVKASRPKINNAVKEIQYKNVETKYKGKTTVENMTIEFRDAIGTSIYAKLMAWQRQHTDFATGKGGYAQTYKKTLTLNMEDPTGAVVQKWKLYGCFIESLDGQDLDMGSDDIAGVTMVITYDSPELIF